MKKIVVLILMLVGVCTLIGCNSKKEAKESFLEKLTEVKSYKVDGLLETFFENGRKQNDFCVYYKQPDYYKVELQNVENTDKQIILKNTEGVYVLVPSVNKNFKIKSSWPTNASYPYLLQSLAQDIANDKELVTTETETTYTVQTKTKMHTEVDAISQKIIFSKETNLPTEVLVYENDGDLFMRCVFSHIDLEYNVDDEEFDVEKSMTTAYLSYGDDGLVFNNRTFALPTYCPEGLRLKSNEKVKDGDAARTVMLFSGESNLTIIQELVNYVEEMEVVAESGELIMVMGNVGIVTENYVEFVFEGIEYTVASNTLELSELINVSASYMQLENK